MATLEAHGETERGSLGTWFAPVHKEVDLVSTRVIAAAQRGILFQFFNPGREKTLFNAIMDRVIAEDPNLSTCTGC